MHHRGHATGQLLGRRSIGLAAHVNCPHLATGPLDAVHHFVADSRVAGEAVEIGRDEHVSLA